MYCPGCGVGIPNSHEVFTVSVAEHRNRTFRVIADQTVVDPVLIHRPRMNLRKAVGGCKPHGISDARIIPRRYPGIVPPVEAMPYIAAITQGYTLLQQGRFRAQNQLYGPFHSIYAVDVANADGGAAVVMFRKGKVDRRH